MVIISRGSAAGSGDIGAGEWEGGLGEGALQEAEPIVELVVSEAHSITAKAVHRRDHRVVCGARVACGPVGKGRALQKIAVVKEQRIVGIRAGGVDQVGGERKSKVWLRHVCQIVVRHDVDMQVRRLQDAQAQLWSGVIGGGVCGIIHGRWRKSRVVSAQLQGEWRFIGNK